ncbi:hypothetical protein MKW94_003420, partial [Papaver nudicaule]|nr:hypothetical protein [Papaver nudicaule]
MFVVNGLITCYARLEELGLARKLFDQVQERDIVSWNSMIAGYSQCDGISYGCMIFGYMNHGFVDEALELFREMKNPGLSTWNSLISGLVQNNHHGCVREFLHEMQVMGFKPNS